MSYAEGESVVLSRGINYAGGHVTGGSLGVVIARSRLSPEDSGYVVDWGGFGPFRVEENEIEPATLQHSDPVQSPSHYDLPGGIQVIDLIRGESFLRGNALKYIFRAPHKGNELEDMKKSREYINWEIGRLENEQSS